jgi:hypothetical protein
MRTRSLPLLAVLSLAAAPARAGVHARDLDYLFVAPSLGAEGLELRGDALAPSMSLAYGATIGVRAGLLGMSLVLQRATHDAMRVVAEKAFGELALNLRFGDHVNLAPHVAVGLARLRAGHLAAPLQGPGGKLGISVEIYPVAALSIGMRIDADAQAYSAAGGITLGYGFTVAGSIGLHL